MTTDKELCSWGGVCVDNPKWISADDFASSGLASAEALPFGNGRSYGDSCLNSLGKAICSRASNSVICFDTEHGLLTAEAGILISEMIALTVPYGWFPSVVPGTQFVTLGGAIANDIHGKNHHRHGTFGCHVRELHVERSDTGLHRLTAEEDTDLFRATIGGLGLTGLIRKATVQLIPVPSSFVRQSVTRFDCLEDYFRLSEAADKNHDYVVAWIDSLAHGSSFGRGHLITGDHEETEREPETRSFGRWSVPWTPPVSPLRGPLLRLFNELYFRSATPGVSESTVPMGKFFFPLDSLRHWNRLYGPRGLHQHQSVIPENRAQDAVAALLSCAQRHGCGSFLTVLKRFGTQESPAFLSFPRPGHTLTLDFPDTGDTTIDLLQELDDITIGAGGAVNPYKDRRMSPSTFAASFPNWRQLEDMRDPRLLSDFWRRTACRLRTTHSSRDTRRAADVANTGQSDD